MNAIFIAEMKVFFDMSCFCYGCMVGVMLRKWTIEREMSSILRPLI